VRISRRWTIVFSVVLLAVLLVVGYILSRPRGPVIAEASIDPPVMTPNADGDNDVITVSYRVRRASAVSIYFLDEAGHRYDFRTGEFRSRGEYSVLFSGVVDGYVNDGETFKSEIVNRLMPDGEYEWVVEAADNVTGKVDRQTGTLVIRDADAELPDLWEFSISPEVFTPNQDGLSDLLWVHVYVPKEATLHAYLIDQDGQQYMMPESEEDRPPGEAGRHVFRYDGGLDYGHNPPPDGDYTVLVEAMDAVGQTVRAEGEVRIEFSGMPLAEIIGQPLGDTVYFSHDTILVGDTLTFELTVENYGDSPIRTTGPESGYVYKQSELYASTGFYEESGAWRVGIGCDTCLTDYPWRWALGTEDTLTAIEIDGKTRYYLMPGERAVITGGIVMENAVIARNPQQFWAGLIHEDVEITAANQRVDAHWIEIVELAEDELFPQYSD